MNCSLYLSIYGGRVGGICEGLSEFRIQLGGHASLRLALSSFHLALPGLNILYACGQRTHPLLAFGSVPVNVSQQSLLKFLHETE